MSDIRRVLSYNDVLLSPRNSELEHLNDADIRMTYGKIKGILPIINAPMDTICSRPLIELMSNEFKAPTTIHRFFSDPVFQLNFFSRCELKDRSLCFLSVGIVAKWKKWIDTILKCPTVKAILIDVANGDTKGAIETVRYIRKKSPKMNIMAGNIATKSGFEHLQDAGANFIRVGIGGGSICTTRLTTGFGVPVLTSIFDCVGSKTTAYLVADGGIENNGDICKAIAAGADMVMCGKILAATNLAGNIKYDNMGCSTICEDRFYSCQYRGMASPEAMAKISRGASASVEGIAGRIPYKGKTKDILNGMIGNFKSAVAYYAGCRDWHSFRRKIKFLEITHQGWEESKTRII